MAYWQAHRRFIINGHVDKAVSSDPEVTMHVKLQRDDSGFDKSCKHSMANSCLDRSRLDFLCMPY